MSRPERSATTCSYADVAEGIDEHTRNVAIHCIADRGRRVEKTRRTYALRPPAPLSGRGRTTRTHPLVDFLATRCIKLTVHTDDLVAR